MTDVDMYMYVNNKPMTYLYNIEQPLLTFLVVYLLLL